MLILVHPIIATLVVVIAFGTAILGWRYRLTRTPGAGRRHVRAGKGMLSLLALLWALGIASVALADHPGVTPGNSGHFWVGTALLGSYSLSAMLMLRWRQQRWVRRLHITANTLVLALVLYQIPLGVNRLYKFGIIDPVPQDQATRSLLMIKFGLESPPVTASRGQTMTWASPIEGQAFGGAWRLEDGAMVQSDCGCSGNVTWDFVTISNRFPLLVFNGPVFGDGTFTTAFNIESGQVDQYAGLAFRIVNQNNYYIVRASASEQSVTLARFNNGVRQVLASFPAPVQRGAWQTLTVQASGAEVTMLLDGQEVGKANDDGWQTGRVGLGTKADSITRFRAISAVTR
jgi:hypothetical protein